MPHPCTKSGFSFIEVMVAIAILAVGLSMLMTGIVGQHQGRGGIRDTQRVAEVLMTLRERIMTEPWTATTVAPIRGLGVATWCTPGTFSLTSPTSGVGVHTEAELLQQGILAQSSGLRNLCYYVEYYRAESQIGGQRGLLDKGTDNDSNQIVDGFGSVTEGRTTLNANLVAAQRFDVAPVTTIGEEALAIRLVLVWRGQGTFGAIQIGDAAQTQYIDLIMVRRGE